MLVEVANELFAAGQFDGALSSYDEALKVAPDAPELHCNRGAALRNLGRIDEALEALDRAIALKPDFPEAYNNKGMTLLVVSRREDALACFQAAIAANERYVQAYWGASQVLNALSRFDEARALECKGIEIEPSPQLYGELAFTLLRLGELDAAVENAEYAIAVSGEQATTRMKQTLAVALSAVAKRHLDQGQAGLAIAAYTKAIETEESDGRIFNRAVCSVQSDSPAEALKDLNRVLELNPRHHNAHILMASLYMISSDWEQSAYHFQSAFALVPSCMDEKLLYQHGFVLLKQNKHEEAEAQFRRVLELDPGNTAAQNALQLIAVRSGQSEAAAAAEAQAQAAAAEAQAAAEQAQAAAEQAQAEAAAAAAQAQAAAEAADAEAAATAAEAHAEAVAAAAAAEAAAAAAAEQAAEADAAAATASAAAEAEASYDHSAYYAEGGPGYTEGGGEYYAEGGYEGGEAGHGGEAGYGGEGGYGGGAYAEGGAVSAGGSGGGGSVDAAGALRKVIRERRQSVKPVPMAFVPTEADEDEIGEVDEAGKPLGRVQRLALQFQKKAERAQRRQSVLGGSGASMLRK